MNRLLKILLSQNSLRKELGFNIFLKAIKFDHHLQVDPKLNYHSVLILAPHPDDDVFGCGGTLKKLSQSGSKITVAYFCDGSGGVLEGRDEQGEVKRIDKNLIEIRKAEAKKSAEDLGIDEQVFFGYKDGKLALRPGSGQAASKALDSLIKRVNPDIIFTPSFLDNHPDHRATNEILINCSVCLATTPIWAYEVWTPIFVNRIININSVIEEKKKAMLEQKSQLKSRAYDKVILGLNQYRAEINGISGYAEGFFATTLEIYRKLYQNS